MPGGVMIITMELILLVTGVYTLYAGKMPTFGTALKYNVRGWPARVIGVICVLPIPLSAAAGFVVSLEMAAQGKDLADQSHFWRRFALEGDPSGLRDRGGRDAVHLPDARLYVESELGNAGVMSVLKKSLTTLPSGRKGQMYQWKSRAVGSDDGAYPARARQTARFPDTHHSGGSRSSKKGLPGTHQLGVWRSGRDQGCPNPSEPTRLSAGRLRHVPADANAHSRSTLPRRAFTPIVLYSRVSNHRESTFLEVLGCKCKSNWRKMFRLRFWPKTACAGSRNTSWGI